ncbi:MAG: hypothetical protein KDD56_10800, partial [Bdellovibrionales bacterium]|nr:hypothetical protein [Bdellovibrionales bacterium]
STKIALTMSDKFVVDLFRDGLEKVVSHADLVFANESEAKAFTGHDDVEIALEEIAAKVPSAVITAGEKGAYGVWEQTRFHASAYPCEPKDLTGAGDMFAAAFMYGVLSNQDPQDSARAACFLAREVITRVGARLTGGIKKYWDEALRSNAA